MRPTLAALAVGFVLVGVAVLGTASPARALPPAQGRVVVEEARKLLGVPYDLGGRLRVTKDRRGGGTEAGREGIDCQGLVLFALQPVARCGWKSFSVMPTVSVPEGQLGAAVEGLAPIATDALAARLARDPQAIRAGDVVHFVGFDENRAEPAIASLAAADNDVTGGDGGARPVWVWHMGLASGGGRFIVGDHFAGEVVEEDLLAYLRAHSDVYAGVLVTRMADGPRVAEARCRRHAPMRAPLRAPQAAGEPPAEVKR